MGRPLLARNRAHSAILIEQRLGGGSDLEAAERVVAWMKKHNEVGLLQRGAQFFGRPVYNPATPREQLRSYGAQLVEHL